MATSLSATLKVNLSASLASTQDIGSASQSIPLALSQAFANGGAANQALYIFQDTRSVAASTDDDIDLAGSLSDAFGNTLTFATIKAIIVSAASTNGGMLELGGDSSTGVAGLFGATADYINIAPGGFFVISNPSAAGYAVTATSADILRISNADSGAAASYNIIIIGD